MKILSDKYNSKEIATLLFSNPFRITKTLNIVNSISIFTISNIYIKTSQVETSVKSGLINEDLIFDLIIQ